LFTALVFGQVDFSAQAQRIIGMRTRWLKPTVKQAQTWISGISLISFSLLLPSALAFTVCFSFYPLL